MGSPLGSPIGKIELKIAIRAPSSVCNVPEAGTREEKEKGPEKQNQI